MLRFCLGSLIGALALSTGLLSTAARANDDDDFKSLMADCNRPDLEASDISGCMERARVLDETRPSPQLEHLLTHLERLTEGSGSSGPDKAVSPATTTPHALLGASATTASLSLAPRPDRDGHKTSQGWFAFLGFGSEDTDGSNSGQSAATPRESRPLEYEAPDEASPAAEYEGAPTSPPKSPSHD